MSASIEELERRLAELRAELREALRARDTAAASRIRRALRETEAAWEQALGAEPDGGPVAADLGSAPQTPPPAHLLSTAQPGARSSGGAIPVREQVHQSLTLLGAPGSPKLISSVYEAFFTEPLVATKLASLRRDEERSFSAQGYARPYYICAALTHDRLTPARGLLAVSVWPLDRRIVAPLSPRADFLAHAVGVAEQIRRLTSAGHAPSGAAWRLLRRFALNIPGAYDDEKLDPERIVTAAHAEAEVHREADNSQRRAAASRALDQLSDAQQLFGVPPMRNVLGNAADGTR
ncbi:hypothetical protein [Streptomyces sp. NPDC048442]|uniref:hypothetical protein n=1 Tax=Streptomyces sp. NPDC048442 TaxID=3154823 RepID=UPI003413E444